MRIPNRVRNFRIRLQLVELGAFPTFRVNTTQYLLLLLSTLILFSPKPVTNLMVSLVIIVDLALRNLYCRSESLA